MNFKSLKKGHLASDSEALHDEKLIKTEHVSTEENAITPEAYSPDGTPQSLPVKHRRKKSLPSQEDEEEKSSKKPSKKPKKVHDRSPVDSGTTDKPNAGSKGFKSGDMATDFEVRSSSKSKGGGKISIAAMPLKRVLLIKAEKLKKKGSVWSKDCIPSADSWSSWEGAFLCAVVHEYSANWSLASDILMICLPVEVSEVDSVIPHTAVRGTGNCLLDMFHLQQQSSLTMRRLVPGRLSLK